MGPTVRMGPRALTSRCMLVTWFEGHESPACPGTRAHLCSCRSHVPPREERRDLQYLYFKNKAEGNQGPNLLAGTRARLRPCMLHISS
ncbi:Os10g0189001 [Oryza sativa Japonica Group]|uniref:Os10g0189001 protein n=1 Tax=Oryza sativa subsp. japonica TaxID=39947 RepID=A0A0N7KRJ3_ORYSJ|nr:Os10g0189001 [Oryza sativa Japonica Group]